MKRAVIFYTIFALMIWGLDLRIALLTDPDTYSVFSPDSEKNITVSESRGYIYDRNYRPLVNGETVHMAAVLPYKGIEDDISDNASASELERVKKGKPCVIEVKYLRPDSACVKYFDIVKRYSKPVFAHIVGYTETGEKKGIYGIEKSFDRLLSECSGSVAVRFTQDGKGYATPNSDIKIINDNYNSKGGVRLTVDYNIQSICNAAAEKYSLSEGAIVVLNAKTSEILAAASYPYFDANNISESIDDAASPFIARFLSSYSVGSVFKPITAAAALEKGISPDRTYDCTGNIEVGGITFNCHEHSGHGKLDMKGAMQNSCNTYFISLALEIGSAPIIAMAQAMGLGRETELADGFSGSAGTLPDGKELANIGGTANLSFGQGSLSATPLQFAAVYACIASGGIYTPPYLLKQQLNNNGDSVAEFIPDAGTRVMKESTAEKLNEFLTATVESGSGKTAKPDKTSAAGKTATAQSGIFDGENEILRTWFCGYFPSENPEYALAVIKENGASPITDCAPIFKYIADGIISGDKSEKLNTASKNKTEEKSTAPPSEEKTTLPQ